jgi:hypothetical protein
MVEIRILDHTGSKAKLLSGQVANKIQNVIGWRFRLAAFTLQRRIRAKFNKYGGGTPSSPGRYPKKLRGHAAKSISVKKVTGKNVLRAGYTGGTPRHMMRLRWLEEDTTISPKKRKWIAIPLSLAAKRFSSDATNSSSSNVRNFKPPGGGALVPAWRVKGTNRKMFLATLNSKRKTKSTGQKHTMHFLLTKQPVTRKARRGLSDAFNAESNTFVNQITAGMQKQLADIQV